MNSTEPQPDIQVQPVIIYDLPEVRERRQQIRATAGRLEAIAFIFGVVGGLLLLLGIVAQIMWPVMTGGAVIVLALWSFTLCQIMNIRANIEK